MQVHARVCEENKNEIIRIIRKRDTYWNNFVVKGASLKCHIGRVGGHIKMIFSGLIHHNINILVLY